MLLRSPARLTRSALYLLFSIIVVCATLYYILPNIQEFQDYASAVRTEVITNKLLRANQVAVITYYAFQTNKKHVVHMPDKLYLDVLSTGLTNIASYCQHNGFPFFFRHQHMVDTENKSAYWSKMEVMKYYTNPEFGYEWILWTDIDVLFTNFSRLLTRDWLDHAHPTKHHVALLLECNFNNVSDWFHFGPVRSGFLAVRNSPQGIVFLDAWADSFKDFHQVSNPEQTALEYMVKEPRWQEIMVILPPDGIHTYLQCFGIGPSSRDDKESFTVVPTALDMSVHFPGSMKERMVKFAKTDERVAKELPDITLVTYDQANILRDERVISIMKEKAVKAREAAGEETKTDEENQEIKADNETKAEEDAKIKDEQQGQPIKEEMVYSNPL